jgi:chaperonin GroEL (HSP60 family)
VISFAGELLKLAEDLLRSGLHTAEIVTGYQRALEKTFEILPELVVKTVQNIRDPKELKEAVKSVLATKQYGYEDLLTDLVCDACLTTMSPTAKNPKLNMDSVRISKLRGGTIPLSSVVKVINCRTFFAPLLLFLFFFLHKSLHSFFPFFFPSFLLSSLTFFLHSFFPSIFILLFCSFFNY